MKYFWHINENWFFTMQNVKMHDKSFKKWIYKNFIIRKYKSKKLSTGNLSLVQKSSFFTVLHIFLTQTFFPIQWGQWNFVRWTKLRETINQRSCLHIKWRNWPIQNVKLQPNKNVKIEKQRRIAIHRGHFVFLWCFHRSFISDYTRKWYLIRPHSTRSRPFPVAHKYGRIYGPVR